jgi:hypothetical protein
MDEKGKSPAIEPGDEADRDVTGRFVGLVKGRGVHLTRSAAGLAAARGNMSILNGGCGPVLTSGAVSIRNGGCGPVLAKGDVSIQNGGTQAIVAAGGATIGRRAFVGLVASPKVTIEEGGRVLMNSPMALAVGASIGCAVVMLSRRMRR